MKDLFKKWWFWLLLLIIIIVIIMIVNENIKQKELEDSMAKIGESASNFINNIENSDSHLDEFTYNYETGNVEYKPKTITLETYNKIQEGMTESQVVSILGNGEKLQPEGSNGFLMTWGDLNLTQFPYYRIQITFDSSAKVSSKNQIGLK